MDDVDVKIKTVFSFEMLICTYKSIRHYKLEYQHRHLL